jgi:hypothetical protein
VGAERAAGQASGIDVRKPLDEGGVIQPLDGKAHLALETPRRLELCEMIRPGQEGIADLRKTSVEGRVGEYRVVKTQTRERHLDFQTIAKLAANAAR